MGPGLVRQGKEGCDGSGRTWGQAVPGAGRTSFWGERAIRISAEATGPHGQSPAARQTAAPPGLHSDMERQRPPCTDENTEAQRREPPRAPHAFPSEEETSDPMSHSGTLFTWAER